MKRNRILSLILVAAMMLSVLPQSVIPVCAVPGEGEGPAPESSTEYIWSFDQEVTLGNTKGLVSGNADGTIKIMNHEGNNTLTPNRAIENGVLTTTVAAVWGNTVGHGVFYKLPADLEVGKIYQLSMNLYGGNDAAAMNGIAVSFGDYTDILTGAGGTIQKWQIGEMMNMHSAEKFTRNLTGNLSTAADNQVVIEFVATEAAVASSWMLVTFPLALNGSYKLGSVALKEADFEGGYTWKFDKTIAFNNSNTHKVMQYGNEANTVGIVSHSAYANYGTRSLKDGLLTTNITSSWAKGANGIYYKLPADLTVGQEYVVSMNLYASAEGTALVNGDSTAIMLSFVNQIPTEVTDKVDQYWTSKQIEGIHNAQTLLTYRAPDYLSTDTANQLAITFVATEAMAENDGWMLISMPLAVNGEVKLGEVTMEAKKDTTNHFLNGDFADGFTGWMTNCDPSYVSIQDSVLNVSDKIPTGDVKLYQAVYLEAGTYRLSFDVLGAPTSWRPVYFMGTGLDNSSVTGSQLRVDQESGKKESGWWKITRDVTIATAGTYYFQMNLNQVSNGVGVAPAMQYDNFKLHKGINVSVLNAEGEAATGLAPYTVPFASKGDTFELTLTPEAVGYNLTAFCKMNGTSVPVTKNDDGSVTIRIEEVTGDIEITADSRKNSYSITTGAGIANNNSATMVQHGEAYSADITSSNTNMKLYSVAYTMGGVSVNVPVVDGTAEINIEAVTGDVTITAVLVSKNIVAQWIFDVTKTLTGNGDWGNASQTVTVAHNAYYDSKNEANNQPNGTAKVTPNLLTVTTNLPSGAAGWADASTVIGYKLPEDLELGATYIMSLPIYAGNDHTTLASSRNGSTRSGVELVFTTMKPSNMWNANDESVTSIYADGVGVLATVAPSIGNLSTDSNNVFHISFTVTEQIKAYAVTGNYLALIVNHQHTDGHYNIGNATLLKVTEAATITTNIGDSVCDGTTITQKGNSYIAHIVPKAGYKVVSAYYTMGGGAPVELTVVNGAATVEIGEVTGDIVITAVTEELEPNNLLTNGSFILGEQFWEFNDEHFTIQPSGGSDTVDDPAFIQAVGKHGGILTQSFKVEKQTNYELTFRYKGNVPEDLALWAITSQRSLAWDSVIYKASAENAEDWTTVTVVFNSGNYKNLYLLFRTVEGSQYGLDNIWIRETTKEATINRYQRPTLGARPSDSPYDDYPYISDEADNLIPDHGFEGNSHVLENGFSKVEADENAWEGNNSLHYSTSVTDEEAANMLIAGDFLGWDPEKKTIPGWEFNNTGKLDKLEFVELGGRHAIKLVECAGSESFNLEMLQKVYLEAGSTYEFSFDFFGVADWGPNLVIYGENKSQLTVKNATTTGTIGEWTTLSMTFTPDATGYYYFAARIHNGNYPQKAQYISNCSVTLVTKGGDIRVDYELKQLQAHTKYWLTLFVKAPKTGYSWERFVTFGLTDPETGDFILMANPDAEGARPYKVDQQLVPMAYDGKWHIITVPFNTGDATWLNFTIYGENCEAWFDNIYIFKEEDAKHFVSPVTDKDEAVVTNKAPTLLGCETGKNLFDNHDLSNGIVFWGANSHRFGVFGNALNVADSGSSIYGNALHYVSGSNPTNTYYIKWIDVEPNTEYTFSAKYAIAQKGEGFVGLINGYRLDSEVSENRLFPTLIAQFGFGPENYLESHEWQTIAVSFNTGERNRIGFVVCDAGGEAYIDELRLFKTSDGIKLQDVSDSFPKEIVSTNKTVAIQNGVVTGISVGTTLENVLKNFENSQYIRVFDAQGNEITDKNAKIGTGCVIQLMDGPVIKDAVKVIINGDANGDAIVDAFDSAVILGHISGKEPLNGVYLHAADIDRDGKITVSDAVLNTTTPKSGKFSISAVGPNAFAQKEEIEIRLIADSDAIKAISGKLTSTDGLAFVKAESELDGWELSVKRDGNDVYFAFGAVGGNAAEVGDAMITLTYRVGMISTYDEAQLAITELLASTGNKLLSAKNVNWMRKAPATSDPDDNEGTVPDEPIIVAARNRLKELSLAEVAISPAFDPELKEYTATVPFEIDKVTVTAIAMDEDAVVTIGDTNLEYVGKNTVAVRVVSADGLQRTYKIVITREPPVEEPTEEPTQPDVTEPAPTEPNTQKTSHTGVILWSAAGALVAAALIILIIILYKRKKQKNK